MDERIAWACSYPFDIPAESFVFHPSTGAVTAFDAADHDLESRIPVLAVGSNAAPAQLRKKFGSSADDPTPIPAVRVAVSGLDAVYAARVSRYGAVPATPMTAPGVTARLHVTMLTDAHLERMNVTEGVGTVYELVELRDLVVAPRLAGGAPVLAYRAISGPLLVDGRPVALGAIGADGRTHPAWEEPRVLEHVAAMHQLTVDEFVARVHDVDGFLGQVNDGLRRRGARE